MEKRESADHIRKDRRTGWWETWPRLFHNLRSSRETELLDEFPLHVVAKWMGHSVEIAAKHYAQITDEHFERARTGTHGGSSEKALQNALQHSAESGSTASQADEAPTQKPRKKRPDTASCGAVLEVEADGVGFEPTVEFPLR